MLKKFLLIILAGLYFSACQQNGSGSEAHDHDHDHEHGHDHDHDGEMAEGDGVHFGETIDENGAIAFEELLKKMETTDSIDVKVTGTVESVCQAKGCWMNIQSADGRQMFVQFKDYGFFMPKDIAGRKVVMDGYAYHQMTSVEELRHYAEDEGKSEEEIAQITEPKEELKFMAHGVILLQ